MGRVEGDRCQNDHVHLFFEFTQEAILVLRLRRAALRH